MTWREDLQPASFRGVPFEVESESSSFGRRVQVHEYPQRDKPWTEDLGRASRTVDLTAFLIGDDYLARRDALLAALEEEGAGTLVHPWYGQLEVNVRDLARVGHSRDLGGMCQISMSFVEAGELAFPSAVNSLGAQSLLASDQLGDVAATDFASSFELDGWPSFVQDAFSADLDLFSGLLEAAATGWQFLDATVPTWAGDELTFAQGVIGMFNRSVLPATVAGSVRLNRNAVMSLAALGVQYGTYVVAPSAAAPARYQREVNRAALAQLFQRSVLVQASGMTAAMPLPVYDDAVLVRGSVCGALDDASLDAADSVYTPLQVLRARVYADVTGRLSAAAKLRTYTPPEVVPGLVLAYDLYEDVDREAEIVERNAVRHPGFLPAVPLKVLTA